MSSETGDVSDPSDVEHADRPSTAKPRPTGWRRWLTQRRFIQLVLLLGLAYVAFPFFSDIPAVLSAFAHANPLWLLVAAGATLGGYFAAFWALCSCAGIVAPVRRGIALQLAAVFTGTATPASVGSLAIAGRFLMKRGLSGPVATAAVGLQSVVTFAVHIVLLAGFVIVGGKSVDLLTDAPSGRVVVVALGLALVVGGVAVGVPRIRRALEDVWNRRGREILGNFTGLFRTPRRLFGALGGAAGGTLSSAVALWAVLIAVGGGNHFVVATFTTMVGATLATAAPTPGGIGAVEAALVAGLSAFGIPAGTALAAAFVYRIINTWIPVAIGWICYRRLERSGAI